TLFLKVATSFSAPTHPSVSILSRELILRILRQAGAASFVFRHVIVTNFNGDPALRNGPNARADVVVTGTTSIVPNDVHGRRTHAQANPPCFFKRNKIRRGFSACRDLTITGFMNHITSVS